jgi:protein involved in polysaccharide export with SLBB domain
MTFRTMRARPRFVKVILGAAAALALGVSPARAQNPPTAPPTPPPTTQVPVATPSGRTAAQDAAAAMGKTVTNSQIVDAIKNSGLSEAQVRARLEAAGFDAKLADPFFSAGTSGRGGNTPNGAVADPSFVSALQSLGIVSTADETKPDEQKETNKKSSEKTPIDSTRLTDSGRLDVFGRRVFSDAAAAFDPVAAGPVDAGYRLGAGDQLQLVISGDLEMAAGLEVRRDGTVVIPQIGQVAVAGLTLDAARSLITRRAASIYSLIGEGKARLDLAVSRVRTNQVFVAGEVERPGSYQVSALATVFRALTAAGGPTVRGTFRNIEVRRGDSVIAHIDLYDYLQRGDASNDIRTQQGDIIFVGLSKRLVVVQGAVRRPAIYELRDREGFADLLRFAGGFLPTAGTDRVQIDRVLPPELRGPGSERAMIDIAFKGNFAMLDSARVYDNDIVTVFGIGDLRRNQVSLAGQVFHPGTYEWSPGLTLASLVNKAQGFLPWALSDRVKIERPIVHTGRTEIFSLDATDSVAARFPIQEFDAVTVLDGRIAFPAGKVTIRGAVYSSGEKPYYERETLRDLVDVAGGFEPWALADQVMVTRTDPSTGRSQQYSLDMRDSAARQFSLQALDEIDVLDARRSIYSANVVVTGAVVQPGPHPYLEHQTLKDLIALSGGFRLEASGLEVASRKISNRYNDTTASVRYFPVLANGEIGNGGDTVTVQRNDFVNVRDNPGFRMPRTVTLNGLFTYPGVYVLERDADRIRDVVKRAGGLLPSAFATSGRLTRDGRPVAFDLGKALAGDRTHDIAMVTGDILLVGPDPSVVYVAGAVERNVVVPFRRGWNVQDYILAAGGFAVDAEKDNIIVEYPSGEIRRQEHHRFYTSGDLTVVSGSTISVGRKPDEKPNTSGEVLTKIAQITTTFVSLFLAYKTATR